MLMIVGTIDIEPGDRDEFIRLSAEAVRLSRAEQGCHAYVYALDPDDQGRLHLVERWEDMDCLQAHARSAHFAAFREAQTEAGLNIKNRDYKLYEIASEKAIG